MGLIQTVAPSTEPITKAEAKIHLRIPVGVTVDDSYVEDQLIPAATVWVENETQTQLITATWQYTLDWFPGWEIDVPRPRLIGVSSLTYSATDGTSTTLTENTDFRVDTNKRPGRLTPDFGKSWPVTRDIMEAVTLTYTAGFGAASAVPVTIKQAMFFLIGHWYTNRTQVVVGTTNSQIAMGARSLLGNDSFGVVA